MKVRKPAGLDECVVECLKSGGKNVIEWLVRLLNMYYVTSMVQVDCTSAWVVSLNKGKSNKYECDSFRNISLLSVEGMVYGRVLIKRIREGTEDVIREEQCGFRRG